MPIPISLPKSHWQCATSYFLTAMIAVLSFAQTAVAQGFYTDFGQNRVQYHDFDWSYYESPNFVTYFYQGGFDLVKEECLLKTDIQRGEKKKFIFEKKNTYKFTNEWFNTSELRRNIHKYVDKDQVNTILEIGCYEGQASFFYFI